MKMRMDTNLKLINKLFILFFIALIIILISMCVYKSNKSENNKLIKYNTSSIYNVGVSSVLDRRYFVSHSEVSEIVFRYQVNKYYTELEKFIRNVYMMSENVVIISINKINDLVDNCTVKLNDNITLSESDIDLIISLVYSESGICDNEHQKAVTSVFINRLNSELFPNSVHELIYQNNPIQYECAYNNQLDTNLKYIQNPNLAKQHSCYSNILRTKSNVLSVLNNGYTNFGLNSKYVIYQSEFIQGSKVCLKLNNTYFCYK